MNSLPILQNEFKDRLITLSDGSAGLRGGLVVNVVAPESLSTAPVLDFIASSETPDRYAEIISADGWRLENYQRNPVFQNAHQYGDILFTIGRALITEVRSDGRQPVLFQRVEFATDVNPIARIAYGLYKGKFLNAVSVGFIPIRWQNADGTERTAGAAGAMQAGTGVGDQGSRNGNETPSTGDRESQIQLKSPGLSFRRKYLEQELLEVSAVGIPANPDALALGLKSGVIAANDLRELSDLLRALTSRCSPPTLAGAVPEAQRDCDFVFQIFGKTADSHTHTGALGARNHEAQLLQLARDVRDALRR